MSARNTLAAKAARRAERRSSSARFSSCSSCRVRVDAGNAHCAACSWPPVSALLRFAARVGWIVKAQVAPMGNHPTPVEIGAPGQSRGLVPA